MSLVSDRLFTGKGWTGMRMRHARWRVTLISLSSRKYRAEAEARLADVGAFQVADRRCSDRLVRHALHVPRAPGYSGSSGVSTISATFTITCKTNKQRNRKPPHLAPTQRRRPWCRWRRKVRRQHRGLLLAGLLPVLVLLDKSVAAVGQGFRRSHHHSTDTNQCRNSHCHK
jgi:hypothetical protein